MKISNPLIEQRADPFVLRHDDWYYFTASVPLYDQVELRRARSIPELATAEPVTVWRKPDTGPMCELIWAPEIHFIDGRWYVYLAAAPTRAIKEGLFQHRMYVLTCDGDDPLTGTWRVVGRMETGLDTFSLDATTFAHRGQRFFLWAQKHPDIDGNSNLYIAPMRDATALAGPPVMLSRPEYDWECRGFLVNEGPAVLMRHGRVFISYSGSATDERYCMGLLSADDDANLLDPKSWIKSAQPVFRTCGEREVYGPGHNSFTTSMDGKTDLLVYHARNHCNISGDPLWNPDRHTCVQPVQWNGGMPAFAPPLREAEV